jgi:hypothetical protein
LRQYTGRDKNGLKLGTYQSYVQIFTALKLVEGMALTLLIIIPWPFLIYKMFKHFREEFKYHGPGFIMYTIAVIIYRLLELPTYYYLIIREL